MLNCHFVSRFATRPWEFEQRSLWYFDFERDRVLRASSETLFSKSGENAREVEARLNTLIETPLSQEVARWRNGRAAADLPWPLFRAIALLLLLQPARSATENDRALQIEDVVMKPESELNQLAYAAEQRYQMGRISVRQDAALLYPERGWFWMPAQDNRGQWGGLPSHSHGLASCNRGHSQRAGLRPNDRNLAAERIRNGRKPFGRARQSSRSDTARTSCCFHRRGDQSDIERLARRCRASDQPDATK